jgi:RND family efflux transporter MFP subunit
VPGALHAPTPPSVDPATLASLAGLSLDKGAGVATRARGGGSKLPWILLVAVVIGGATYHFKGSSGPPAEARRGSSDGSNEQNAQVKISQNALLASGYIAARAPIVLSASSNGRIKEMLVDNGVHIKKGQLLAVLDDRAVKAELSLAGARLRDAQRQLQRTKMLVKAQAATPVELDRALGNVEVASAEMHVIQQRLEETRIRSPIDGTVLEVLVQPGEAISAAAAQTGGGVLRIADLSALLAEINIGEAELKQVYLGQSCEILSEARRDVVYSGVVREIAEQADRARGTVMVKVDLENVDGALKPGMAVQVRLLPPKPPGLEGTADGALDPATSSGSGEGSSAASSSAPDARSAANEASSAAAATSKPKAASATSKKRRGRAGR